VGRVRRTCVRRQGRDCAPTSRGTPTSGASRLVRGVRAQSWRLAGGQHRRWLGEQSLWNRHSEHELLCKALAAARAERTRRSRGRWPPSHPSGLEAAHVVDELRDLAESLNELGSVEREVAVGRAKELMVELLDAELLSLVGQYERRLVSDEGTSVWRGVVVRVAPAAIVAAAQRTEEQRREPPTRRDQQQLDRLLGMLTRPSMRLIDEQDFLSPSPDILTAPLSYFVNEYDEVEHVFADVGLEERRQLLLQATNHFLHQEAINGFDSRLSRRRDGGWTPGDARDDAHRWGVLSRRQEVLYSAARDVGMSAHRHPRVEAYDRELEASEAAWTAPRRAEGSMTRSRGGWFVLWTAGDSRTNHPLAARRRRV
jgi:hypothetical protein